MDIVRFVFRARSATCNVCECTVVSCMDVELLYVSDARLEKIGVSHCHPYPLEALRNVRGSYINHVTV